MKRIALLQVISFLIAIKAYSQIDLRKVTEEYKDSSYYVQQVGESMISQLRQKIIQMTQTYQFKGTEKDLRFVTYEAKGCGNLVAGNEETVSKIRYTYLPSSAEIPYQSERITYYGCNDQILLSELIQIEGGNDKLTASDILKVNRKFFVQSDETRRIYRVYIDNNSTEAISIDSIRNKNEKWVRAKMKVAQTELLQFHSWQDPQGNLFTKIKKPGYSYQIKIGNSFIGVDAQSVIEFKVSNLSNGIRYVLNDEITTYTNFNNMAQDVLFAQIGGFRFAAVFNNLLEFFPISQAAPKLSQLEKQLDEARILLESKLNPDQVLKTVKDILDGVRSGKIIDNRN